MHARVLSVPFGETATRALGDTIAELRAGDLLAPATVTVPSAAAGTTLRRRLAERHGGLVGVAFRSFPQVAQALAAPVLLADGRPPVAPVLVRGHLRAVLAEVAAGGGGALGRSAASSATERAMERTLGELADLDDAGLDALARAGGPVTAATVDVARRVRQRVGPVADRGTVLRAAIAAVRSGRAPLAALGPLVVHLPRRLRPAELDLLATLAAADHPVHVLVGRTGEPVPDEVAADLLDAAARALGTTVEAVGGDAAPAPVDELVRTPDPAEEAAVATRLVVDALAAGTRAEQIAVVHRVRDPYAALLHEQLAAAEVAHHGPSVRTLAQSVTGRVLLGALALPGGGWRRADVVAWWRSGPVRDLATGRTARASRWDRIAREAGIVCGLDQWRQRLDQAAEDRRLELATRPPSGDGADPSADAEDRRLLRIAEVRAAVDALGERLDPMAAGSWADWAGWAGALLDDALGTTAGWPPEEATADGEVRAAVAGLAGLDGVDRAPDLHRFRAAVERELEQPGRAHGRFGHGVAVGPLAEAVGADLALVVVVGAAEGTFPPRGTDDALVPDRDRRAAGGVLAPRGRSRAEEARDLLAVLAGARRRVLVAPRSDPRAQRERQAAPAFLRAAGARAGRLVTTEDLRVLRDEPWFADVESFEWWPVHRRDQLVGADVDRAALLADHRRGAPVERAAPVVAEPALARGLEAAAARIRGDFDAWSGNVGARPDLLDGLDRPRSPTGLEDYAACPFRYFLGHVLGVSELDDPTELDEISGRDLGSLLHAALEVFIAERGIGKAPDEPWTHDDRRRFEEIAQAVAAEFEAQGRTGRALLWGVRWESLRRLLGGILDEDEYLRRTWRSTPVAVELAFGIDDDPAVLALDDGRALAFRGRIDRVDRTDDGRLVVIDYKTGRTEGFKDLHGDVTARGRKLQLGVYALAARRVDPAARSVQPQYWFVDAGKPAPELHGPEFDDAAEERFRAVVTTLVDGVVAGRFPANPGDEEWARVRYVHEHCRYCRFDRVCSTTRGWQWQRLRRVPELATYVELAEGEAPG